MAKSQVDAAGFAYTEVTPATLPGRTDEHYYLVSDEVQGGDCFYGAYRDSCGGTSGGLPMYFTGTRGPLTPQGSVYRPRNGAWTESEEEQWQKEPRRGYGAVNLLFALTDMPASSIVV